MTGFDQAAFVGQDGELDAVTEVEFGEDPGKVGLDGCLAEVQLSADLGVGQSPCDQSGDRKFAVSKVSDGRRGPGGRGAADKLFE